MTTRRKSEIKPAIYSSMLACLLVMATLTVCIVSIAPQANAANEDKPSQVIMQDTGSKSDMIDVMKSVTTLDLNSLKNHTLTFDVSDKYNSVSNDNKRRRLVLEDSSGKQTQVAEGNTDKIDLKGDQIVAGQNLKLITLTKGEGDKDFVKRYEQQLNVRFIDAKTAEQKPSNASSGAASGISQDGGSWSFSNGLEYTFKNTGFKFLDGTTMNLGALKLPLQYKHKSDGSTIVGINCSPEDEAFFKAVKNGNVWQKYSTDEIAKKTSEMDKGWSGKKFGTWGGKSFDWNVCGYMEFNTQNPNAPRAVNLIISMGAKAEGHAQYLCFTGTLTFTIGGKAMLVGKLIPAGGIEGKFGVGAYAGLELYIGLGLQYVASVGAYGKGQINIDFQILPDFYLDDIKVSGDLGAKAKVFGFTVFSWSILKGEKVLFSHSDIKDDVVKKQVAVNKDGTASSPLTVASDTPYPADSRDYLDSGDSPMVAQSAADSTSILKGIYGETELACVTTNDGPVIAYVADAAQVGDPSRDPANRSVIVYSRYKNGAWSAPKIIDTTEKSGKYADYSPSISTDGETCYISWLAADSKIDEGSSIGQVGRKLDVNIATVTKDDNVLVETVCEESDEDGTMPASPKVVNTDDGLYVGWYTNQTSGQSGEVIGVSGTHNIRLYKRIENGNWVESSEVSSGQSGAITSFDVGVYGETAACSWSLDEQFSSEQEEITLNGVKTLASSTVYYLVPESDQAQIVVQGAANAQFAKCEGADVLTYAIRIDDNDGISNPYLSVQSSYAPGDAGEVVLDGSEINLPTPYYEITGDMGEGRAGNISFLKAGDGTCDIQALVTTGAGATDWTSIVEATADTAVVTDYCATYADGKPLFVYTTQDVSAADDQALSAQAEDDGSADLNQTTDGSLKHLSVTDVDYDEYEVDSGQNMPVTVYFDNDGMLDVPGVDLWMLDDGAATKVASNDASVAIDDEGNISFEYLVPAKDAFTEAREFTVYAAPAGAEVTADKIKRELANESAMTVSLGASSLALETEHQIVDDQESIVATVTNDGIVPHGAKLVFLDSDTNAELMTMNVPELGENETFTGTYDAANGYFQKDGIKNITITLENDGTEAEGYEINNTEFVNTWEIISDAETPTSDNPNNETPSTDKGFKVPTTGDQIALVLILILIVLAVAVPPAVIRASKK